MKLFETPKMELVKFTVGDIITTSTTEEELPPELPSPELFCI